MTVNYVERGADRYVVGKVARFDQKNEMFKRPLWDPNLEEIRQKFYSQERGARDKSGYMLKDQSLVNAGWHLETRFARGSRGGQEGLYAWESEGAVFIVPRAKPGQKIAGDNSAQLTNDVKKAARFFGASLVGVCELDPRWLYSHGYYRLREEPVAEIRMPDGIKYAISMAIEMDYQAVNCSPAHPASAATGLNYSKMAFVAGLLAQYIRGIGYRAIPCGNDTACNIPIAIDAGLGELARNGLLITPAYGPRVRLCTVYTDLPLIPDRPIEFGVWDYCQHCERCAESCPSQAIRYGAPTATPNNISNREGLLRWPIDAEKCLSFWANVNNGADCSNCIRICSFNKPPGWLHNMVRWGVKNTRWLDPAFVALDKAFGYGRKAKASEFWNS